MAQTQTSNASNSLAVVLGTNQIVERCFAKMANDVTAQVRDKLIDGLGIGKFGHIHSAFLFRNYTKGPPS